MRRLICCVTLSVLGISGPAQVACWTPVELTAAATREFDTMLMVSALKCRYAQPELLARYNVIVRHNRPALIAASQRLRGHFQNAVGTRNAEGAYDRYATVRLRGHSIVRPHWLWRIAPWPNRPCTTACRASPFALKSFPMSRAWRVQHSRSSWPPCRVQPLFSIFTVTPKPIVAQSNALFGPVKASRPSAIIVPPMTLAAAEKPPSITLWYKFELR